MKHNYTLLLTFILLPFFSFSQSNYKAGYFINLQGDTIKGFVNYRDWVKSPNYVSFKKDRQSTTQTLTYANAKGFGITGYEYYKRYVGAIGQNYAPADLSESDRKELTIDSVFVKLITSGKNVALYYLADYGTRYFISEMGGEPTELISSKFLNNDDENQPYRIQLAKLVSAYQPQNADLLRQVKYIHYGDALKYFTIKINGSENNLFEKTNQVKGSSFFITAGVNNTSSTLVGNIGIANSKKSSSTLPSVGIGVDVYINKNVRTLVLETILEFSGSNISSANVVNNAQPYTEYYSSNQHFISFNPQLLYNIVNYNNFKFYAAIGGAINYATYTNNKHYLVFTTPGNGVPNPLLQEIDLTKTFLNVTTKVGLTINNRFNVYLGYAPKYRYGSLNGLYDFNVEVMSYRAGIGYSFGAK